MGIFRKLLNLFAPSNETMISMASHQELIELLLPGRYWHGDRAEKVAHLAEKRLIMEVPHSPRIQLFLGGLEHREATVRYACAERLSGIDMPEVTDALVRSLADSNRDVRFEAALHLEYSANRFYPGQITAVLQTIRSALTSETDQHVRKCLESASKRLESL